MEVLQVTGDRNLAEVAVVRFRDDQGCLAEVVDGLAPPLSRAEKWIINVSTQLGCPIGCPFCDAGGGYAGDLTAEEILAEVEWALSRHPDDAAHCRKLKVHLARMGEPSLNDQVPGVLAGLRELIPNPDLWVCLATVAPKDREDWFARLFEAKERFFRGRFQLQFSIQSTNPAARARLIPWPHLDLPELAGLGRSFFRPADRRVVLNFALAREVPFEPEVIRRHFPAEAFAVKLTPVNPTGRGLDSGLQSLLRTEQADRIREPVESLRASGYDVILSVGDPGEDNVGSNCGQAARHRLSRST